MSNLPALTDEQMDLIKNTVAKGATDNELKLFLYRCKEIGLDPLKPGQIFFIKYGNGPGTIVIGRDGFRARAASIGLHTGTKVGIIRDDKGHCLGAWCEVYRKDWKEPAREEVSLKEYDTGKGQWAKMPETMIKKVAEVAALRMAFPDQLSGLYSSDEMEQAEVVIAAKVPEKVAGATEVVRMPIKTLADVKEEHSKEIQQAIQKDKADLIKKTEPSAKMKQVFSTPKGVNVDPVNPSEYTAKIGRDGGPIKGKKIKNIKIADLMEFMKWLRRGPPDGASHNFLAQPETHEFLVYAEEFLGNLKQREIESK